MPETTKIFVGLRWSDREELTGDMTNPEFRLRWPPLNSGYFFPFDDFVTEPDEPIIVEGK